MKSIKVLSANIFLLLNVLFSHAQSVNWGNMREAQTHMVNFQAGWDYAITAGVSYSYKFSPELSFLKTRIPMVLQGHFSLPSGKKILDDFKVKTGLQIRLLKIYHFHIGADFQGVFRQYGNQYVRLSNFGSDVSINIGYYRPKWFVVLETGADRAIVSHFKHSWLYRSQFPGVENGWYEPASGGNFRYGLMAGVSLGNHDIYVKAGNLLQWDFKTKPFIPYYASLGYNFHLGKHTTSSEPTASGNP